MKGILDLVWGNGFTCIADALCGADGAVEF